MANRMQYLAYLATAMILSAMASTSSLAADKGDSTKGSGQSGNHSMQMHQMMQQGSQEMQDMSMSGDMDKDFAMMMRHHHQQGVKMAQMELDHGKDPQMKAMAKKIMASQEEEIKKFDQWLKSKSQKSSSH